MLIVRGGLLSLPFTLFAKPAWWQHRRLEDSVMKDQHRSQATYIKGHLHYPGIALLAALAYFSSPVHAPL